MKKIFTLIAISIALNSYSLPALAAKPTDSCVTIQEGGLTDSRNNPISVGYDAYGYNYQARMFNGWYDNYSRPTEPVSEGDFLIMKWNDAWLSNKDCTGDGKLDRHFGYAGYRDSGAWLTNHAKGTYESTEKYTSDVTGTYTFDILYSGNNYYYDVDLVQSGNAVTGTLTDNYLPAQYPNKVLPVTGSVSGNDITLGVVYPGPSWGTRTYIGNIDGAGIIGGTWSDDGTANAFGDWSTSDGQATIVYETCKWSDFIKIVAVPSSSVLNNGYWMTEDNIEIGPAIWVDFAIIQEVSSDSCGEYADYLMNYRSNLRSGLGNW